MSGLLCRIGLHRWRVTSLNLDGHQSYRLRTCDRCGTEEQQRLGYFGKDTGEPWVDASPVFCTHSVTGGPLMACMRCAIDRQERGLI